MEIAAQDINGAFIYNFKKRNLPISQYKYFMRQTGLFDLIENHIINNLYDYTTGVEAGLDSNGRKNRGGDLMEDEPIKRGRSVYSIRFTITTKDTVERLKLQSDIEHEFGLDQMTLWDELESKGLV